MMWDDEIPMGDEQSNHFVLWGIVFGSTITMTLMWWGWRLVAAAATS